MGDGDELPGRQGVSRLGAVLPIRGSNPFQALSLHYDLFDRRHGAEAQACGRLLALEAGLTRDL